MCEDGGGRVSAEPVSGGAGGADEPPVTVFRLFKTRRTFRTYWLSSYVNQAGGALQNVVAAITIYSLTGSTLWVGIATTAYHLPILTLSMVAGMWSDRFDRRILIAASGIVASVASLSLGLLDLANLLSPIWICAALFVVGSCQTVTKPATYAIVPALVEERELGPATALSTLQINVGVVSGAALGSVFLANWTPGVAFLFNATTYYVLIVWMIRHRHDPALANKRAGKGGKAFRSSIGLVRSDETVRRALATVVLAGVALESVKTTAPAYAATILELGEAYASTIIFFASLGATAGLVTYSALERRMPRRLIATIGFSSQLVGLAIFLLLPGARVSLVGAALVGFGLATLVPFAVSTIHRGVSDDMRGRAMGLYSTANLGSRPLSALAIGAVATAASVPVAIIGAALTTTVFGGWLARQSLLRTKENESVR